MPRCLFLNIHSSGELMSLQVYEKNQSHQSHLIVWLIQITNSQQYMLQKKKIQYMLQNIRNQADFNICYLTYSGGKNGSINKFLIYKLCSFQSSDCQVYTNFLSVVTLLFVFYSLPFQFQALLFVECQYCARIT